MAGDERIVVAAAVQGKAKIAQHDLRSESAVQAGREGYGITLPVDDPM